jgi:WD40 repeat protein
VADIACTKELTRLFSGVQRALQLYATPITSHALQIYQSFRATSLERGLEYVPNDYIIRPRIVSQTTSDWSSISPVIEGHLDCVNSVAYSSDGARVVSGSSDMTVRVWDAQAGKQLSVLKGHSNWVLSAEFSSDAAHIVSGSSDRTVRVWDVSTSKQLTG